MNGANKRTRRSRLQAFKAEDKVMLIHAVQIKPILWDTNHKKHFHGPLLNQAWDKVAVEINRDVKSCKAAWKSLRDSYKYFRNLKQEKGENSEENSSVNWKFAENMAFLPNLTTSQRIKSSTFTKEEASKDQNQDQEPKYSHQKDFLDSKLSGSDEEDSILEEVENELNNGLSDNDLSDNFNDTNWPSKKRRYDPPSPASSSPSQSPTPGQKMCDILSKLLQNQHQNPNVTKRPIFDYWESLLSKMPPEIADVVEQKMTKLLWAEQAALKK
ncbi:uncharacterized protein [Drosophila takahashii]|uniref:uncharacterized protein n=1 Tax=Drosophila takahashii TaxID=29030 RepID=UPI001CF85DDC|nr:uncharacterized protein LOC108061916 [Drosophila takahashii]